MRRGRSHRKERWLMFRSESDRRLHRLFKAEGGARPEHKAELEAELMERFDQGVGAKEKVKMRMVKSVFFRRVIVASAAAAILGVGACVAPVDVDIDVGRSV